MNDKKNKTKKELDECVKSLPFQVNTIRLPDNVKPPKELEKVIIPESSKVEIK
ncbi:MAG: hypothetical protein KJ971_04455 [Firmicutes bacterium]|nr:hypothetical protein [Bacillota bacterium]